jgi:hypothetical protein
VLFKFKSFKRLYLALSAVIILVLLGSLGYVFIVGGYTWVEALYITVITISTVGFGEVHELNTGGMIFTSFLIISSISAFAYSISALTTYFVDGEYEINPGPSTVLNGACKLFVLGTAAQIRSFNSILKYTRPQT